MILFTLLNLIISKSELVINLDIEEVPDWYGIVEYSSDNITEIVPPVRMSSNGFYELSDMNGRTSSKKGGHMIIGVIDDNIKENNKYGVLVYKNSEWMSTGPMTKEELIKLNNKNVFFNKIDPSKIPDKIKEKSGFTKNIKETNEFPDLFLDSW